jgi:hypothetical protein
MGQTGADAALTGPDRAGDRVQVEEMMKVLRRIALAMLVTTTLALAACGGTPAAGTDPAGVVGSAFAAAESGGLSKLTDYACASQSGDLTSMFGGDSAGLDQIKNAGIDPNELFDSMKVDFENIKTSETSKTDSAATVHVTGNATITFDDAKFREIMKKIFAANGVTADDAMIDAAMTSMAGQLSQSQEINEDVKLVQENGKWLICG